MPISVRTAEAAVQHPSLLPGLDVEPRAAEAAKKVQLDRAARSCVEVVCPVSCKCRLAC